MIKSRIDSEALVMKICIRRTEENDQHTLIHTLFFYCHIFIQLCFSICGRRQLVFVIC